MPSIFDVQRANEVTIDFNDDELDLTASFQCVLPHQRLLTEALNAATKTQKGKQTIDSLTFARKLFVPCVQSWSFDEPCDDTNKQLFVGEDAALNKMATHVSLKLMRLAQAKVDDEEGN